MANLEQHLAAHSIIGLDTSIFIYHFEAHPDYLPLTRRILKEVESGRKQAVTSTVTLMELTVLPWRINRPDIARQYEILLTNFPNLQIIEVNREVARRAAQLRAEFNIRRRIRIVPRKNHRHPLGGQSAQHLQHPPPVRLVNLNRQLNRTGSKTILVRERYNKDESPLKISIMYHVSRVR